MDAQYGPCLGQSGGPGLRIRNSEGLRASDQAGPMATLIEGDQRSNRRQRRFDGQTRRVIPTKVPVIPIMSRALVRASVKMSVRIVTALV